MIQTILTILVRGKIMIKIIDNYMVCEDCIQMIVNDDCTGLDYHYNRTETDQREKEIRAGIAKAGWIVPGDNRKECEHSILPCDCCKSKLHGRRYHCIVFSDK